MATYTYLIDKKEARDCEYNIDEFIVDNIGEMIDDWFFDRENVVTIVVEIPIAYDDVLDEEYTEEVESYKYNIRELIYEYLDNDELVDLVEQVVIDLHQTTDENNQYEQGLIDIKSNVEKILNITKGENND